MSAEDIAFGVVIFFIFGLLVLVGTLVGTSISTGFNQSTVIPDTAKQVADTGVTGFTTAMNYGSLLFVVGIMLITVILAATVKLHPVFIFVFILVFIPILLISIVLSNTYQDITANAAIASVASQYTVLGSIIEYLPAIVLVWGVLIMFLMYKTWSQL